MLFLYPSESHREHYDHCHLLVRAKAHVIAVDRSLVIIDHIIGGLYPSGFITVLPVVADVDKRLDLVFIPQGGIEFSVVQSFIG